MRLFCEDVSDKMSLQESGASVVHLQLIEENCSTEMESSFLEETKLHVTLAWLLFLPPSFLSPVQPRWPSDHWDQLKTSDWRSEKSWGFCWVYLRPGNKPILFFCMTPCGMVYPFGQFESAVLVLPSPTSCTPSAPLIGRTVWKAETCLALRSIGQQQLRHQCVISVILIPNLKQNYSQTLWRKVISSQLKPQHEWRKPYIMPLSAALREESMA